MQLAEPPPHFLCHSLALIGAQTDNQTPCLSSNHKRGTFHSTSTSAYKTDFNAVSSLLFSFPTIRYSRRAATISQPQITPEQMLVAQGNAITDLQKQFAKLGGLTRLINTANTQVEALISTQKSPVSRPKASLPETEKFNGTSQHYETWLPLITAKLKLDGPSIGSEKAQFFYIYSRLEDKVQQLVQPQLIQTSESDDFKPSAILDQLHRHFNNPHKVQDAEEKIQSIKQYKDEHFIAFLARFERLFYRCRANKWPEHIQMATLRRAISSDLKEKLRLVEKPSSYTDLVSKLQRLAGSLPTSHSSSDKTTSNGGDKMDVSAIAAINSLDLSCIPEDVESGHSSSDNGDDDMEEFMTEQQNYSAKHT